MILKGNPTVQVHLGLQLVLQNHSCGSGAFVLPGLAPALLLQRSQPLPDDSKFGRVDHFGFSAAVGELQRAVPLALSFAHDGVGQVVFDFCRYSAG